MHYCSFFFECHILLSPSTTYNTNPLLFLTFFVSVFESWKSHGRKYNNKELYITSALAYNSTWIRAQHWSIGSRCKKRIVNTGRGCLGSREVAGTRDRSDLVDLDATLRGVGDASWIWWHSRSGPGGKENHHEGAKNRIYEFAGKKLEGAGVGKDSKETIRHGVLVIMTIGRVSSR